MERYMICFTNGQFVKLWAYELKDDNINIILFDKDGKIIASFNWSNIAGWINMAKEVE